MKRFTETTKWRDPWFRKLSPISKLLWQYLCDHCNSVGIIDFDIEACSFDIGEQVKTENLEEIETRIQRVDSGKIFIPKFINFQYGTLSSSCPAHKPIFKLVNSSKLIFTENGYSYPTDRVLNTYKKGKEEERKGKGQEEEKEEESIYSPESRAALHYLNEKSGRKFRESESSLSVIQARINEAGVDFVGIKKMIDRQCARWIGTDQEEYLRPETLFGKTKFDSYYAAKDLPLTTKPKNGQQPKYENGF